MGVGLALLVGLSALKELDDRISLGGESCLIKGDTTVVSCEVELQEFSLLADLKFSFAESL